LFNSKKLKQSTGEEIVKQTLTIADTAFVMASSLRTQAILALLGVNLP